MSLEELEQDPFDSDEFVERLAWRTTGGVSRTKAEDFDPMVLHAAFEKTIKNLKEMNVKVQKNIERLESTCKDEEKVHWQKVTELQKHNQVAFNHFQALDERINFVATKVVHLGDQLEGVNTPRTRAAEAQLLMKYFSEFLETSQPTSDIFTDRDKIFIAADVIQKLYLISQELPGGSSFEKARTKISIKYDKIESQLISDFGDAYRDGDKRKMKRLAATLSQFKGYNRCIYLFIEENLKHAFTGKDIFAVIPPLCARTNIVICEVFSNPENVMSKFVRHIYEIKIKHYLASQLGDKRELERYLQNLFNLFQKTTTLSEQLHQYRLGNDAAFLAKATKSIFSDYLQTYIADESQFLQEKSAAILARYYHGKKHSKKQIQSGGIHELRRDLQGLIGAKANLNLGPTIENYGGETFLSQEVAINLLQETKLAFKRCKLLSGRSEMANNAGNIFDILVQKLCIEHIDYALELGLQAIPLADPKTEPEIYFFDVVGQANTMFHLFEKQFSDSLIPMVSSSPKHVESLHKKREIMESMENKLDIGLDRTISAMAGWVKFILTTEQKKTDYKPEDDDMAMCSPACKKVVKYIQSQKDGLHEGLDGKNVEAVLTEFGIRFHRVVYEHLQQFQFNSMGAMLGICDVNEYRKCVNEFQIPVVIQLFDTLHSLCNLLVVVPENLHQVCSGEQLAGIDKTVLLSFVSLRADYKSARLASHFK